MPNDAPGSQDQLAAIDSLSRSLGQSRIEYWLFGGWAVDFWVGRVTRPHEDIDVAAWRADYDAIGEALSEVGWVHTPVPDEVVGTRYRLGAAEVEFTFLERGSDGEVIVPLPEQAVVWSPVPFGDTVRELAGVASRILPLDFLRAGKSVARTAVAEAAKDVADFQALSEL